MTSKPKRRREELAEQMKACPTLGDGSRIIPLTRGMVTIVSAQDFPEVSQHFWCAFYTGRAYYAQNGKLGYLHRFLLGGTSEVDHRNGDSLDNRRDNLRACTTLQNNYNQRKHRVRSERWSPHKGVSWSRQSNRWAAMLKIGDRPVYLGLWESEADAAIAVDIAAKLTRGSWARLNFPDADIQTCERVRESMPPVAKSKLDLLGRSPKKAPKTQWKRLGLGLIGATDNCSEVV